MNHLLKALQPAGARRGPRRPGMPSLFPRGNRRASRPGILGDEPGPYADDLQVAIFRAEDPREYLR